MERQHHHKLPKIHICNEHQMLSWHLLLARRTHLALPIDRSAHCVGELWSRLMNKQIHDIHTMIISRVENCKSSQIQMSQCFFNGFWCIETEGKKIFAKKNIFDWWKWTRNLGFGHFQRFLHFFFEWQKIKFILTIPSMSIVIWNLHAKSFPMVPWC